MALQTSGRRKTKLLTLHQHEKKRYPNPGIEPKIYESNKFFYWLLTACPAYETVRQLYLQNVTTLINQSRLSPTHKLLAAQHLAHPNKSDLFKLLLCSFNTLSFINSSTFLLWFPTLAHQITDLSINHVQQIYQARNNTKHLTV